MQKFDGYRSQITAVVGAVFAALSAFFPDMFSPEVQTSFLTIILFLYGVFFAAKVQRNQGG